MHFDQTLLATFDAVATHGTVGRAAMALDAPQPTVSRRVKALEDEVGLPLFDRDSRGMRLTAAGEELLPRARLMLNEMLQAREDMDAFRGRGRGVVKVGGVAAIAECLFPAAITTLAERAPQLRVELRVGSEDQLARALADWEIDLMFATQRPREIDALPVGSIAFPDRCSVFCSETHPLLRQDRLTIDSVLQQSWALPMPGATPRIDLERLLGAADATLRQISLQTGSISMILGVVARSHLLGWLPERIVRLSPQASRLRILPIPELELNRTIRPFRRAKGTFPSAARQFMDAVLHAVQSAELR